MQTTAHSSYWQQTVGPDAPHFPPLDQDIDVDVAIVGGGITGLTAARWLKEMGKRVAVIEGLEIGAGTTGFTTGHLDASTDEPLARMISNFGEQAAREVIAASRDAINQIESWCSEAGDCEFARLPSFQYTESPAGMEALRAQGAAARRLGLRASLVQHVPLPFACAGAVRIDQQGRLHSLRYLHHLAKEVHGGGCAVFENTSARPPEEGQRSKVETSGGKVTADSVFVATHSPFLGISSLEFRVYPYQSYVIGVQVEDHVPDFLFWDDGDPYHYVRLASAAEPSLVLIGGEDHKTGEERDERKCYEALEQYAHDRFNVRSVEHRWSAQHYIPADGLPLVGRVPGNEHIYVATGFAGTGLTLGTVAGKLVANLIMGRSDPLAEILNPGRLTPLASAGEFVSENLNVVRRFVGDRFAGPTLNSPLEVPPGKGAIVAADGKRTAVYCDPSGRLYSFSPVCTHAGCIVHWNDAERTWDCPCHGGRFTAEGKRFYGPPPADLAPQNASGG
ncbi:MAG TPA: FAD-dependent oxidoreductase [Pirellulaceae bacterium]|nr:FAD-dependent oxidoreductase [Pirellulaceae bacterium]